MRIFAQGHSSATAKISPGTHRKTLSAEKIKDRLAIVMGTLVITPSAPFDINQPVPARNPPTTG